MSNIWRFNLANLYGFAPKEVEKLLLQSNGGYVSSKLCDSLLNVIVDSLLQTNEVKNKESNSVKVTSVYIENPSVLHVNIEIGNDNLYKQHAYSIYLEYDIYDFVGMSKEEVIDNIRDTNFDIAVNKMEGTRVSEEDMCIFIFNNDFEITSSLPALVSIRLNTVK